MTSQTMATSFDSDVAGAIESLLGLASSTKCSNLPAAESCPLAKPMNKEINSAHGLTKNSYGMKTRSYKNGKLILVDLTGTR